MKIFIVNHPFAYEVECVTRLFFPGEKIAVVKGNVEDEPDTVITAVESLPDGGIQLYVRVRLGDFDREASEVLPVTALDDTRERVLAVLLFRLLHEKTGILPPWGILTGVRPVRLCITMMLKGKSESEIFDIFTHEYLAAPEKARLAISTAKAERRVLESNTPGSFSLYIGIPFCPTRCLYCSFVSHAMDKAVKLAPDYVRLLCEEIRATGKIARELGLKPQTIYMGGGTPTVLDAAQLAGILDAVGESFDLSGLVEYTVEAGRPDTVTREKLAVLKGFGVDRISVNPQTMNDDILRRIGRAHSSAQTLSAFSMARETGFRVINTDLIAGLPGESGESFLDGLNQVLGLSPENITIHTLTVKRSSALREVPDAFSGPSYDLSELLDKGRGLLEGQGYFPYYLYRQKGTMQNLENTGYTLPGCESFYNVYIMEETQTVLSVGAGAVTKLCAEGGNLQRVYNFKYPYEYISRFEEVIARKSAVRSFYERHY